MSKKKKRNKGNLILPSEKHSTVEGNKALIKIGLIIGILLFALVGFGAFVSRQKPAELPASGSRAGNPAAPLPTPQYNANAPAKEYIYAGGKLLAVSEPVQPAPNDLAVWRLSTGTWWVMGETGGITTQTWGNPSDLPAPGDFDGDGKTDFCVFRPNEGKWYVIESSNNAMTTHSFGANDDIPVPADFDGDSRTDLAVYRTSDQKWYIKHIASGNIVILQYGNSTDKPIPSDFDGDGKSDIALWRSSNATWYLWQSSTNSPTNFQWGVSTDKAIPGDFDGDGKTDYATWQTDDIWKIRRSSDGTTMTQISWGNQASDWSVQGDYDRDGKSDIAVWRPSNGTWYIIKSSNGNFRIQPWGENGDIPVPAPYRR